MSEIAIQTNHKPRPLVPWMELPEKWQREFDYIEPDERWTPRFAQYKGWVYDVFDTLIAPKDVFPGWSSYHGDSFFSGVLFLVRRDYTVICGTYFS